MLDRVLIDQQMRQHYDQVWAAGDSWEFETSPFEQQRFAEQLRLIEGQRYPRCLEIGCGGGCFTRLLASVADQVLALDVSPTAVEQSESRMRSAGVKNVDVHAANIMEFDLQSNGLWDLVVLAETVYCLGWLYSMFDIAYLASNLLAATRPGGRLLLANAYGADKDWLLMPYLIDTYRDLFRNVGFTVEKETVWCGTKHAQDFQVLMTVFRAPIQTSKPAIPSNEPKK
jgi:SAM-dependent methyltransferase